MYVFSCVFSPFLRLFRAFSGQRRSLSDYLRKSTKKFLKTSKKKQEKTIGFYRFFRVFCDYFSRLWLAGMKSGRTSQCPPAWVIKFLR